ncbi:MAG: hypothetical protein WA610_10500 [Thermodesulfovibrionales bacterium]
MKMLIVFFLFTVSACAASPIKYVPPHEVATSEIYFINNSSYTISVAFFEESRNCKRRRDTDPILPKSDSSTVVRADEELTFQFHQRKQGSKEYCLVNLRFTPISGKEYLFETIPGQMPCKWEMREMHNNRPVSKVILEKIDWETGWDENGSFCNH